MTPWYTRRPSVDDLVLTIWGWDVGSACCWLQTLRSLVTERITWCNDPRILRLPAILCWVLGYRYRREAWGRVFVVRRQNDDRRRQALKFNWAEKHTCVNGLTSRVLCFVNAVTGIFSQFSHGKTRGKQGKRWLVPIIWLRGTPDWSQWEAARGPLRGGGGPAACLCGQGSLASLLHMALGLCNMRSLAQFVVRFVVFCARCSHHCRHHYICKGCLLHFTTCLPTGWSRRFTTR